MATMQEEMARVDYNECNDWEKQFYDDQKWSYTNHHLANGYRNKMPKLS